MTINMAVYRLCSFWRKPASNLYKTDLSNFRRCKSTSVNKTEQIPKQSWKFLILAFGVPVSGFLFYKTVVEPSSRDLSEEEKQLPYITRLMIKYFMEDPIKNKQKIHEHIQVCRQVADKRLALNHAKQNPIAPGKFQETITREKQNVAYDTEMH
ncbi:uncharacterized protein LOC114518046 [Dendronephthya gigantea]|uniref:uncharacterized protein LOC114518046 n=1 Tax=Dendronephthya gigantea TaxID=151771 RepID=UPI00106C6D00|nr:uncharacterized protein LOC114518046 [Dendronephthya gigantea]